MTALSLSSPRTAATADGRDAAWPSGLQRVALPDCPPQPWRNGGGLLRELLVWPAGATGGASLRVSVARIDRSGPFSAFPEQQRWFAVLAGDGVQLDGPDGSAVATAAGGPLHFDGGSPPRCQLRGRTSDALNLMAPPALGLATMARATIGSRFERRTLWRGLFADDAATLAIGDGAAAHAMLPPGTLVWTDAGAGAAHTAAWQLLSGRQVWWLALEA